MARNSLVMAAPPDAVWAVLADPPQYADWVVGSKEIRDWDEDWPKPGARFYHRVGIGPLTISDDTEVAEADPPNRLVLIARARPLGAAHVELTIEADPAGSRVTMVEDPAVPFPRLLVPPPVHALIRARNEVALRRLRRLAEEQLAAAPAKRRQKAKAGNRA